MANFNQSLQEAVCVDDEVFFGPVTEKEKKIREQFERFVKNDRKAAAESFKAGENEISRNDSLYKSFSVDDSKYDSFDDSLNEEIEEKLQETKHVTVRRNFDRLKSKRHAFYDSLEDVCSLVSHVDKCSISCENDNVIEKQKIVEDSLQSQPVIVANKIHGLNEQINFDEDSLAIIELENTFDDSLEECNLLSSIEIEEVSDIDNVVAENPNIYVEQKPLYVSRNLFDTSVEIIYEKKSMIDSVEKESCDNKNIMFDSLSSSDFKDILRDSLEESENFNTQLNLNIVSQIPNNSNLDQKYVCVSEKNDTSVQIISEKNNVVYRVHKEEFCDNKNRLSDSLSGSDYKDIMKDSLEESENYNGRLNFRAPENAIAVVNQNDSCASGNLFDTSVQIISEKINVIGAEDKQNFCIDKNRLFDSLSNSAHEDFSKDSVEEAKDNSKPGFIKLNADVLDVQEPRHIPSIEKDIIDTSVQIICEKINNLPHAKNISVSKCNNALKDRLENFRNSDNHLHKQMVAKTTDDNVVENIVSSDIDNEICNQITSTSVPLHSDKYSKDSNKHSSCIASNGNKKCFRGEDSSVVADQIIPVSVADDANLKKEIITVDSCHLKLLNDNLNLDKDLKFQLHIEVTVGDQKCQIASQDIKLLPVKDLNSEKSETNFSSKVSITHNNCNTGGNSTDLEDDFRKSNIKEQIVSEKNVSSGEHANDTDEHRDNIGGILADLEEDFRKSSIKEKIVSEKNVSSGQCADNADEKSKESTEINITQRIKRDLATFSDNVEEQIETYKVNDISLLQALDLHDISMSFLNESVIQSKDSIMPLNLCTKDCGGQNIHTSEFKNESKENLLGSYISPSQNFGKKNFKSKSNKTPPNKLNYDNKTPKKLKNSPSFKETSKKTPGTKIPVRKIDNFTVPIPSSYKVKQTPTAVSTEKGKKCPHTPHSADSGKKTPGATPQKTHHFCKVRNTIFSKVPQITPSKKFMNIQSPVAKYIRSAQGCGIVKTPVLEPVLRDCMNKLHIHQQYESPHHGSEFHSPKDSTLKQTKRKA